MQRVRVGVIGLGEVAQIIHLPILEALADQYEIGAICDISPTLLNVIGERYGVAQRYTDFNELVQQADLDAVFVLNSDEYHADGVIGAARNGKHVLVEKPMCLTLREAEEIIQARDEAGVQVMVAYMRRFAPAFLQAIDEVRGLESIGYARIRDIIGRNRLIIDQANAVHRPGDFPAGAQEDRSARATRLVQEAIGDVPPEMVRAYRLLLGLSSHDLSAMRELLGVPQRVVAARQWRGGNYLTALFEYDGYCAVLETGVDDQVRFDAHIEVYGPAKSVRIQYDSPYIRHLPTTLVIQETKGDVLEERIVRPTFKDPYTHELEYFHTVATEGVVPKTTPEDFAQDLRLIHQIVAALQA
jgi:predicted dehydrogenase